MKWNAELYDQKHDFVFKYGENFLQLLEPKPGEHILDLGCGSGYLTNVIREEGAIVLGVDSSAEMIEKAKQSYPQTEFKVADATDLGYDASFNAVFSNAVLHWIKAKNQPKMMNAVFKALKPGGRFVAEMGGKGNVEKMISALKNILDRYGYKQQSQMEYLFFPSVGEYTSMLEKAGFKVTYAALFDRETLLQDQAEGVKKWATMFASDFFTGIKEAHQQEILQELAQQLGPYYQRDGEWYADYKRLRFIAIKEV
ncbi:class I SAM-dependent methyltransferase [Mucilaginibacter arboris]|uniref:Methyltransferase domain-containing protein n=1 Tax=Mucilaginibacter arboris TaxID=2682090 RepID=A0A7K1STG2_9SPHI|nr:class I SAM-dependent methyltransferase [Mucilaginibacter arboris]MVN20599.1 methyltransferase domain-containing protein [Mucilaginibacter arboris]